MEAQDDIQLLGINDDFSVGEGDTNTITAAINLPADKMYHIFISHSAEDFQEILEVVKSIEERFNIKCMIADRDFQAGKDITDNIKDSMEKSMKVLLVLSPRFMESGYCMFEMKLAFQISISRRQNVIIPLILRPLEGDLPSSISNLTYIDASKYEDLPKRIMKALKDEEKVLPTLQLNPENEIIISDEMARKQNGAILLETYAQPYYEKCSGTGYEFRSLTLEQNVQLLNDGVMIVEEYEMLRLELNRVRHIQYLGLAKSKAKCAVCCVLITFMILVNFPIAVSVMALSFPHTDDIFMSGSDIFWGSYLSISTILIIISCCWRRKISRFSDGEEICWKHTSRFYREKKCFILCDKRIPKLCIIRYDTKQCQRYLEQFYSRRYQNLPETDHEMLAVQVIEKYIKTNPLILMNWKKLPQSVMNNHNSFRGKSCLCHLILDEIIG